MHLRMYVFINKTLHIFLYILKNTTTYADDDGLSGILCSQLFAPLTWFNNLLNSKLIF